jgi:hypothetical protein
MSVNRFFSELSTMLIGPGEKRFGRELGRLLGLKIAEPESGPKAKCEDVKHDCTNHQNEKEN